MNLDDPGTAGWLWLIAAVALGIAELAAPGVFLVFLAIAAAVTGVATLALGDLPLVAQLLSFTLWSVAAVLIGKRWYRDYPVATTDPLLNNRAARLIGEVVVVAQPITAGCGRVLVGDGVWDARGADASAGERVRVTGYEAGYLLIEPLPPRQD